ncbi:MAG: triphosphoribosyl-dephospho-CoA synthase [Halobacteriaceae archaeon]
MRTPAENAQLALLAEVAGTPKPGNVDRVRDLPDLRFEHFLAGAVGAGAGLRAAEDGAPVGDAFETAVAGMADQEGRNTQFGALLLLVPLVRAASEGDVADAPAVTEGTTVGDAAAFYRAFEHVDVHAGDPPADADDVDVRRGADAVPAVRERGLTLHDVMALGAESDDVAAEWTGNFDRTFRAADLIADAEGSLGDRAATAYLELLAEKPDTLVATRAGPETASEVRERAAELLGADRAAVEAFADELVERGVNPGTTADLVAAGLFVALQRGVSV